MQTCVPSSLYDRLFRFHVDSIVKQRPWIRDKANMEQTLKVILEVGLNHVEDWPEAKVTHADGSPYSPALTEHLRLIALVQAQLQEMQDQLEPDSDLEKRTADE